MKRTKKWMASIALVLVVVMMLAACGSSSDSGSAAADDAGSTAASVDGGSAVSAGDASSSVGGSEIKEILGLTDEQIALLNGVDFKIGMLLAMTGSGDFYGRTMGGGAQIAVDQINELTGSNFSLAIEDHQSGEVNAGTTGVRSLINKDNVSAILSSYGNITVAIVPQIQEAEILTFNPGGADTMQLNYDYLWMGNMMWGADAMPSGIDYIIDNYPDLKKAAIMGVPENGIEVWETLIPTRWTRETGGEIVLTETVNVGTTDFSQSITKIKSSGAEVLFTVLANNEIGVFLKQLREANVDIPVMGVELTYQQIDQAGEENLNDYFFGQVFFDPESNNPFAQSFLKAYEGRYGETPDFYAANYYQSVYEIMYLILDVLENGGDIYSGAELQASLEKINDFPTVYGGEDGTVGRMSHTLEDHSANLPMGIYKYENGGYVLLADAPKVMRADW